MRILNASIALVMLSLCAPAHADERFLPYIDWLVANSEYEYNGEELPTIEVRPYAWVEVMVYGPDTVAQAEQNGSELPEVRGAYLHDKNVILFPEGVDVWEREDVIVHELYHYLQHINGHIEDCLPLMERPAYEIHWEWVEAHGREADFEEPNWLFVFVLEMSCYERYMYHPDSPPFAR